MLFCELTIRTQDFVVEYSNEEERKIFFSPAKIQVSESISIWEINSVFNGTCLPKSDCLADPSTTEFLGISFWKP